MEMLKCYTIDEAFKIISDLSDVDTALDVINKKNRGENVVLKWVGDKLQLKDNDNEN